MKQFLTSLVVAGAVVCLSSSANASLPSEAQLSLETQEFVATGSPTDTMFAQCYNGGYSYAPVYRSRSYYYPRSRGGVSIQLGGSRYGGYRGFPGYYGSRYGRYGGFGPGFGPGVGFGGPGFGRSGVGLFLSF